MCVLIAFLPYLRFTKRSLLINSNEWKNMPVSALVTYSHSIVAGGLLLTSYTTRFTPRTLLMIRVLILPSTS